MKNKKTRDLLIVTFFCITSLWSGACCMASRTDLSLDVIAKYAPTFYFHKNEQYFPCTIEHLLRDSTLRKMDDPNFAIHNPTQDHLNTHRDATFYIDINESQFKGMPLNTAPMYYAVQKKENIIDIHYLLLYAYQGGQALIVHPSPLPSLDCIVSDFGVHQGDLERVCVRLSPNGSQYNVIHMEYEAHGHTTTYNNPREEVAWENSHPIVSVALNGHACYNSRYNILPQYDSTRINKDEYTTVLLEKHGLVDVVDFICVESKQTDKIWRPSGFKRLGVDATWTPINDQKWASFGGHLGKTKKNKLLSISSLDRSNVFPIIQPYFINLKGFAMAWKISFPSSYRRVTIGEGPKGPGSRDWVTVSNVNPFKKENEAVSRHIFHPDPEFSVTITSNSQAVKEGNEIVYYFHIKQDWNLNPGGKEVKMYSFESGIVWNTMGEKWAPKVEEHNKLVKLGLKDGNKLVIDPIVTRWKYWPKNSQGLFLEVVNRLSDEDISGYTGRMKWEFKLQGEAQSKPFKETTKWIWRIKKEDANFHSQSGGLMFNENGGLDYTTNLVLDTDLKIDYVDDSECKGGYFDRQRKGHNGYSDLTNGINKLFVYGHTRTKLTMPLEPHD